MSLGLLIRKASFFQKIFVFACSFFSDVANFFAEKHGSVLYTNVGERYRYFRGKKIRHFNAFQEPTVHANNLFFHVRFATFLRKCTITVKI
jgi:hypothetical protein